jgi:CHASE3 domain sensor protein
VPSRRQIEEHVDALRERADGAAFADAVAAYSRELDEDERETLAEVLMARAGEQGAFDRGVALRLQARGWFRRQWDRVDPTTLRERR